MSDATKETVLLMIWCYFCGAGTVALVALVTTRQIRGTIRDAKDK